MPSAKDVVATPKDRAETESSATSVLEDALLRTIFEEAPDGISLTDPTGRYVAVNARFCELVGRTRTELLSMTSADVVVPEDRARLSSARLEQREGATAVTEHRIRRGHGGEVDVEVHARVLPDGCCLAFVRDASARRHAAAERQRTILDGQELTRVNERLLDGIFELLPVDVWIADRTGRIVRTNAAGLRVWAGARYVGPSEFDQYRGWWADTGEPIAADEWALARALEKGETSIGEILRIQCFDGTYKTIINSALPLRDEQGRLAGAIVVNEDVTELRKTEEALRRALMARDEMLRVVSHELRSPLQSVALAAQHIKCLLESGPSPELLHTSTDRILRASRNMKRLVDDLLDIESIETGRLRVRPTRTEPDALLHEALDAHQAQAESLGITLAMAPEAASSSIEADHDRMLQVLSNLIGNALKFTPAGGTVSVHADDDGDEVRVSVIDSGAGIAPELAGRAFDPFWQGNATDRRGHGLGLAIAKGIVEAHGGRIWLESAVGRGTRVCFTVPRATKPDEHPAPPGQSSVVVTPRT